VTIRVLSLIVAAVLAGCVYLPRTADDAGSDRPQMPNTGRVCAAIGGCSAGDGAADVERGHLVWEPREALEWRLAMIDAAESTLDLQYFIWEGRSGKLLLLRLLEAADRGVRVRLLIDDIYITGQDALLRAVDSHSGIEVRVFNPFQLRIGTGLWVPQALEFIVDGARLTHRMHNKLMVTDQAIALLGGRNIGDEYFGLSRRADFFDLDIALRGAVVGELTAGFEAYWNSRWVYPLDQLIDLLPSPKRLETLQRRMRRALGRRPDFQALLAPVDWQAVLDNLQHGHVIEHAQVLIDRPELGWFVSPDTIVEPLAAVGRAVEREVLLVSPYVVLTGGMRSLLEDYARRGVEVALLTNSLGSTDVTFAHALYERDRHALLTTGVQLHEFRADAELPGPARVAKPAHRHVLHGKFFVLDREQVYVGSLNLDARSLRKNTELGVVLQSPTLATELRALFDALRDPQAAWRVSLDDNGRQRWTSGSETARRPPAADARKLPGTGRRIANMLYRWLPFSGLL
jgi:cardiolipin synthase C